MKKLLLPTLLCVVLVSCYQDAKIRLLDGKMVDVHDDFDNYVPGDSVLLVRGASPSEAYQIETAGHSMKDDVVYGSYPYLDEKGDTVPNHYFFEYRVGVIEEIN